MSATAVCEQPVATSLSLGELLARAHEDVHTRGVADCPVCGGALVQSGVDAECTVCGSRLG